jgi:hypothetical protein
MGGRALSAVQTRMGNMELLVTSACSLSYLYSFLVFAGALPFEHVRSCVTLCSHPVWLATDARFFRHTRASDVLCLYGQDH